jgi:hypothetical protein
MIAGVPQGQVNQVLADHVIILDKGDHTHPALAPWTLQGIKQSVSSLEGFQIL